MRSLRFAALLLLAACVPPADDAPSAELPPPTPQAAGTYVDPPPVRTFPASRATVQLWIDSLDVAAVRAHAWDIWESITSPSGVGGLPVWETWYSGHEIFELAALGTAEERARLALHPYELPAQLQHRAGGTANGIPIDAAERLFSFNRYTRGTADVIISGGYNLQATFDTLNAGFDRAGTPVRDRKIEVSRGPVDSMSIVLKPVFQFIRGDTASVIPVWNGVQPQATTALDTPTVGTWRHGVIVDPTGTLRPGDVVIGTVNAEPPKPLLVVPLDAFYHRRITCADSAHFSQFAAAGGDDIGFGNQRDTTSVFEMIRPGNIALLVAMHVTGKEIPNWTWQTFWWSPEAWDPQHGADRPASIRRPWNHYNMDVAYWMADPAHNPLITFNPYLETNLTGTVLVHGQNGDTTKIAWTGVHSNCMTCHRRAVIPGANATAFSDITYWPNGHIDPADSLMFSGVTKVDFLWSIQVRARGQAAHEQARVRAATVAGSCPA